MQQLTMTRRSFAKTATLAGAAFALGTYRAGSLATANQAWADEASEIKMFLTMCHGCNSACGVRAYVRDGVVFKLEGDPHAPISQGSMCLKGLSQLHTCYSPRRVLYPLKRSGPRGAEEMAWERISWDEAIELAAAKITEGIEKYGTYSFFTSHGGGGGYCIQIAETVNKSFGSPNVFEPGGAQCYMPRMAGAKYMYGFRDQYQGLYDEPFKGCSPLERAKGVSQDLVALVLWGSSPSVAQTAQAGRGLAELRDLGVKTVVVDPNMSNDAAKATVWLRVRPGTDAAMILSWFRYIFENKLYDEAFVKEFTNLPFIIDPDTKLPFFATDIWPDYKQVNPANTPAYVCWDNKSQSLKPFEFASKDVDPEVFWSGEVAGRQCRTAGQVYKDAADPYTLQKAEEICWVPADLIEKGIRVYADAPVAGIGQAVATDQTQVSSQVPTGLLGLDMIMGYVNRPGCTLTQTRPVPPTRPTLNPASMAPIGNVGYTIGMTPEENAAQYASLDPVLVAAEGQMMRERLGTKNHKGANEWPNSHIASLLEAIKTGIPYTPRVWYDVSGNKLAMLGNVETWFEVFNEIDFCICQYPMITSFQAELADLIFPLEEWLEYPGTPMMSQNNYQYFQQPIIHLGETVHNAVPITKVLNATSKKLNEYLADGNEVVFGGVGATVGASTASPSQSSTASDPELQTSVNSSYYFEKEDIPLNFPLVPFMTGAEEDTVQIIRLCEALGVPDLETLQKDNTYQQPIITPIDEYFKYGQHLQTADDGLPVGFATESRKCEVYCTLFIKMAADGWPYCYPYPQEPVDESIGQEFKDYDPSYEYVGTYAPICQHVEPAESPIEGDSGYDPEYPLIFTSGRVPHFHHGTMRHAPFNRELYPVPNVLMHPDTAAKYGLKHMDWAKITSRRGSTKGQVYVTRGLHEKVIWMERFWFPECFDNSQPKKTGGWRECNVNLLTKNTAPFNHVYGSYTLRGFTVKIEPSTKPDNIWTEPKEFEPFMPTNANQYLPELGSALEMEHSPIVLFDDWDRNAPLPPAMGPGGPPPGAGGPPDGADGPPAGADGPPAGIDGPPAGADGPPPGVAGPPPGVDGPPQGGDS
jgi:anaerobic selenocysteine-containing dehydrogenase